MENQENGLKAFDRQNYLIPYEEYIHGSLLITSSLDTLPKQHVETSRFISLHKFQHTFQHFSHR